MSQITWYGISATQIKTNGKYLVIDPYLTKNPLGPYDLSAIKADIILCTHGAKDHFGDAVELAKLTGAILLGPVDCTTRAKDQGVPPEQTKNMVPGSVREIMGIKIKALHTEHVSCSRWDGKIVTGVALSYLVTLEDGLKLYHAGDSALHSDFKTFGEIYQPDIGMMPCGMFPGATTEMDPEEAAIATDWLRLTTAVPIHFDPDTQADYVERFKHAVKARDQRIDVIGMTAGKTYNIYRIGPDSHRVSFQDVNSPAI